MKKITQILKESIIAAFIVGFISVSNGAYAISHETDPNKYVLPVTTPYVVHCHVNYYASNDADTGGLVLSKDIGQKSGGDKYCKRNVNFEKTVCYFKYKKDGKTLVAKSGFDRFYLHANKATPTPVVVTKEGNVKLIPASLDEMADYPRVALATAIPNDGGFCITGSDGRTGKIASLQLNVDDATLLEQQRLAEEQRNYVPTQAELKQTGGIPPLNVNTGNTRSPFGYVRSFVRVQSKTDKMIINDIKVNRGRCKVKNNKGEVYLQYGDKYTYDLERHCKARDILSIDIYTNWGVWRYER